MAAKLKKVSYNFFQLTPKKRTKTTPAEIRKALQQIHNTGDCFHRQEVGNKTIFVRHFSTKDGFFIGTLLVASSQNLPARVHLDTLDLSRLPIGDREGIEKNGTFLIDPQANILVMEKSGVSSLQLCAYLSHCASLPKVQPAVIINPAKIQQYYNMTTITKFSVKIAQIEDGGTLFTDKENGLSIDQVTDAADDTNTDELRYELAVSPQNKKLHKSLNKNKIANFIREFLGFKESREVRELKVTGEYLDEDGSSRISPIDLIQERLHDYFEIEEDRHSEIFNIEQKHERLIQIYAKHRKTVTTTYAVSE